jgi:uncharacterized protein (TIGR03435 family)
LDALRYGGGRDRNRPFREAFGELVTVRLSQNMSRRWLLIAAVWVTVALPVFGQSLDTIVPMFDAVSIKPHDPNAQMTRVQITQDRYATQNISLESMITYAYDLKTEDQVAGLSGPVASGRFDVEAKMDEETVAAFKKLSFRDDDEKRRLMLQAMLADRFNLKVHHESKDLSMYALVVAKGGFKLKEADPNDTYPNGIKGPEGAPRSGMMMMRGDSITGQGITIAALASQLSRQVHRLVEDKTELKGRYDVSLQFTPNDIADAGKDATGESAKPSLFTALQEQLGLRLEPTKGPMDTS